MMLHVLSPSTKHQPEAMRSRAVITPEISPLSATTNGSSACSTSSACEMTPPFLTSVSSDTSQNGFASDAPASVVTPRHQVQAGASRRRQRQRSQSTPMTGSADRRTIFGSFWQRDGSVNSETDADDASSLASTGSAARRPRAFSAEIPASRGSPPINFNVFTPPPQHKSALMTHFASIQDFPLDNLDGSLPPLPSPLDRHTRTSGGVYPLMSPKPILQKTPSYSSRNNHNNDNNNNNNNNNIGTSPSMKVVDMMFPSSPSLHGLPLTITESYRRTGQANHQLVEEGDHSPSSSTSSPSADGNRRVQFDPRVTVTEYEDAARREWYTDHELESFKFETIELVQRYLLKNPSVAADYCGATMDPVTGKLRKKTLFSVPVLNNTDPNADDGKDSLPFLNAPLPPSPPKNNNLEQMAKIHIRRILIVDPNKLILDLFCKSMLQIFPHAVLTAVQTVQEASLKVQQEWQRNGRKLESAGEIPRGFDLIIVEERLEALPQRGFAQHKTLGSSSGQQLAKELRSFSAQGSLDLPSSEWKSGPSAGASSSGSDLIRRIWHLEDHLYRRHKTIDEEDGDDTDCESENENDNQLRCQAKNVSWRSLLIGVCVNVQQDTHKMWQNGADMVWAKPPPPMGEALRNQLLGLLVRKRQGFLPAARYR